MAWIWIWISTSLPVVLAVSIVVETVQQHAIWTILYRSSLITLIYGCVVFLMGVFILAYLQPRESKEEQVSQTEKQTAGNPVQKKPAISKKAAVGHKTG
ncbi:hypothetical protein K8S19_07345 [bacterium]|nr:hypothetical protein [bacterium]